LAFDFRLEINVRVFGGATVPNDKSRRSYERLRRAIGAIEPQTWSAHIGPMARNTAKSQTSSGPGAKRDGWYRGVKLQTPSTPPRTSLAKLKDAVRYAVGKNADALVGGK
jgi:hypothetical protein